MKKSFTIEFNNYETETKGRARSKSYVVPEDEGISAATDRYRRFSRQLEMSKALSPKRSSVIQDLVIRTEPSPPKVKDHKFSSPLDLGKFINKYEKLEKKSKHGLQPITSRLKLNL